MQAVAHIPNERDVPRVRRPSQEPPVLADRCNPEPSACTSQIPSTPGSGAQGGEEIESAIALPFGAHATLTIQPGA